MIMEIFFCFFIYKSLWFYMILIALFHPQHPLFPVISLSRF